MPHINEDLPKRKCHGYPGHKCDKMITDYRCPSCWEAYRKSLKDDLLWSFDSDYIYSTYGKISHKKNSD